METQRFFFKFIPKSENWSSRFLVSSNIGPQGKFSKSVSNEMHSGQFSALIYSGDLSYDNNIEDIMLSENFLNR